MGYPPNRIDLLTSFSGITFEEAWQNKVSGKFGEVPVFFIGKEELKKNKKAIGSKSDINDLENLCLDRDNAHLRAEARKLQPVTKINDSISNA